MHCYSQILKSAKNGFSKITLQLGTSNSKKIQSPFFGKIGVNIASETPLQQFLRIYSIKGDICTKMQRDKKSSMLDEIEFQIRFLLYCVCIGLRNV